jgi:hypothetical protein
MSDDFHIFRSHDVFLALSHRRGYYAQRLEGFGSFIVSDLKRDGVEATFSLSADLIPRYPLCTKCKGSGRIEAPGTVQGQYLASEFDAIDFSKTGTKTCDACRGMGVTIAGFF